MPFIKKKRVRILRVLAVPQVLETEPYASMFKKSSLWKLILNAADHYSTSGTMISGNNLSSAIIKVGKRVFLDLDEFDRWIISQKVSAIAKDGAKSTALAAKTLS